jgi:hypothetical protein
VVVSVIKYISGFHLVGICGKLKISPHLPRRDTKISNNFTVSIKAQVEVVRKTTQGSTKTSRAFGKAARRHQGLLHVLTQPTLRTCGLMTVNWTVDPGNPQPITALS